MTQFLQLKNNFPLSFNLVAFRSNILSPQPQSFDPNSEHESNVRENLDTVLLYI